MKTRVLLIVSLFMALFVQPLTSVAQWKVEDLKDEFGDPADEAVMSYYTSGKFSSPNIVSDKTCYVNIFFTKDYGIGFQIVEYGDFYASLYTGVNIDLKMKTGSGEVKTLRCVPRSQGRLFPYNDEHKGISVLEFVELLKKENKLKCYFADYNGRSYSFDINCNGFTKNYTNFLSKNHIDNIKILEKEFLYRLPD